MKHVSITFCAVLLALGLLSCPGDIAPAVPPVASSIEFADGTYVKKLMGSAVYVNTISGEGTGAITYSSSEPSVAIVDAATGEVRPLTKGQTIITASKAATGTHLAISDTYALDVLGVGSDYLGGKIAYFFTPSDEGYDPLIPHGILAAPTDQTEAKWSLDAYKTTFVSGASGSGVGTGYDNSIAIIAQNGAGNGYAAGICDAYANGNSADWFLPSIDELTKLYINRALIGGFVNFGTYWSSTNYSSDSAKYRTFDNSGTSGNVSKSGLYHVRAIKYF